jgi:hypothetical protein
MKINFNKRLFIGLVLAFIPTTIILTLTHEGGHYIALRLVGLDARIHYMYTEPKIPSGMLANTSKMLSIMSDTNIIWITISGPLVTILLGSIGFILLWRSPAKSSSFSWRQWCYVLLAFFLIRQVIGLFLWIFYQLGLYHPRAGRVGDEVRLAKLLDLPRYSILISIGVIGSAILAIIIFKFIPRKQRITFIFSALIGCTISFFVWFGFLGKLLLP